MEWNESGVVHLHVDDDLVFGSESAGYSVALISGTGKRQVSVLAVSHGFDIRVSKCET